MTEKDIRDKITKLRVEHNHLSEYQLSLDLGQSKGYIQGIASGKISEKYLSTNNAFAASFVLFSVWG